MGMPPLSLDTRNLLVAGTGQTRKHIANQTHPEISKVVIWQVKFMSRTWDGKTMAHMEECGLLTGLIIDLKKRELGREHEPITMERLEDASKAIGGIQQCRKQALFKGSR